MNTKTTFILTFFTLILGIERSNSQTPIHHFTFNNTFSNSANTATLGFSGALNGSTFMFVPDRKGNTNSALRNNVSVNLTASLGNLPVGNAPRSISIWAKFTNISGVQYLVSYGTGTTNQAFGLTQDNSNNQTVFYGGANDIVVSGMGVVSTNMWHNYVLTYDGTTAKVFRNGVLIGSGPKSWNTVGTLLRIGSTPYGSPSLAADIDDLKIYDVALTDAQAKDIFNSDYTSLNTDLIAYYSFDGNTNSKDLQHNLSPIAGTTMSYTTGVYGLGAAYFNGSQTLIDTTIANVINNKEYSVAFWQMHAANTNTYPTYYELFGSNYVRYTSGYNAFEAGYAYNSSNFRSGSITALSSFTWRHIVYVFKSTGTKRKFEVYVDGEVVTGGENDLTDSLYKFNKVFSVGGGTQSNGTLHANKYYTGSIDELFVYNRALTQQEIFALKANAAATVLPTTLLSFNGKLENKTAKLNWTTTTEINTQSFEVEYSNNGREFSKVSTITAAGNSNTTKQYSYTHAVSNNAVHYYRLKMNDKDGKFTYSNIVKLKSETKTFTAEVFPTIVKDNATISIQTTSPQMANIFIIDNNGRIVKQMNAPVLQGSNSLQLETKNISNGFYTVQIKTDKEQIVQRIIKQ